MHRAPERRAKENFTPASGEGGIGANGWVCVCGLCSCDSFDRTSSVSVQQEDNDGQLM